MKKEEVDIIIKKYKIQIGNYEINSNGTIDVEGDVWINHQRIKQLPLAFGRVNGEFDCSNNRLTTLRGAPYYVGRTFDCGYNRLKTLEFAPKIVNENFSCPCNSLISLMGCPVEIAEMFDCSNNYLTTLKLGPSLVGTDYYADNNDLVNLIGSPIKLNGYLLIRGNYLDNLHGCPLKIGGNLVLSPCVKSIDIGNQNTIVKQVEFENNEIAPNFPPIIPQIVMDHEKWLEVFFKYHILFDDMYDNDLLDEDYFMEVIMDIKEGLL